MVESAPAPGGGVDLLMVVQIASIDRPLHLGAADGPVLALQELPYTVTAG